MSLAARVTSLAQAIGADIKSLQAQINALGGGGGGSNPWTDEALSTAYTNSTVTAGNVFVGFVPNAGSRYIVDVLASVQAAAATTGVQVALTGPTSGVTSAVKINSAASATADLITHTTLNTFQAAAASLTTPTLLYVQAILEVTSNTLATPVRLQARSEVAGSLITIRPGSSMRWRTI